MSKTDAEWQALDARIAREVMGWVIRYYGIPSKGRPVYCESMSSRSFQMYVDHWQPHKDVAQALMALDTVADKYPDVGYTLERATPKRPCDYMCALGNPDAPETLAFAPILREAICSALEKWMDAQRLRTPDGAADG